MGIFKDYGSYWDTIIYINYICIDIYRGCFFLMSYSASSVFFY